MFFESAVCLPCQPILCACVCGCELCVHTYMCVLVTRNTGGSYAKHWFLDCFVLSPSMWMLLTLVYRVQARLLRWVSPLHVLEGWKLSYSWLHAENDGRDKEAAGWEDTHNGHVRVSYFCVSLSSFVGVCALYRVFEGAFKQMFECFHIHWSPSVLFCKCAYLSVCVSVCPLCNSCTVCSVTLHESSSAVRWIQVYTAILNCFSDDWHFTFSLCSPPPVMVCLAVVCSLLVCLKLRESKLKEEWTSSRQSRQREHRGHTWLLVM